MLRFFSESNPSLPSSRAVKIVLLCWALFPVARPGRAQQPIWVDFADYDKSSGIEVRQEGALLVVTWPGERGQTLRMRFNLADLSLLIRDVSVAKGSGFAPVLENALPRYFSFTGKRRGGWDNFFDVPASHHAEIRTFESSLTRDMCKVTSDHERVQVSITGLDVGIFCGQLIFTFYKGSNLIQQEAAVRTSEPDVAYYYDAWLTHCSTKNLKSVAWLNTEGALERRLLVSSRPPLSVHQQALQVRRRSLVAEGPNGSIGVFPAPHQFFFARDVTTNFGYVFYNVDRILEDEDLVSIGIRQVPEGGGSSPLYNAPPGTEQRWKILYYAAPGGAEEALRGISAYTRNDSFKPLPGYQTFTSHYHMAVAMSSLGHPKGYEPEFKKFFKDMGVKIVHEHDFHGDGHAYTATPRRLDELRILFNECKRLSDSDFLLLPGEEGNLYFGGHWSLFFPRPVYFFWVRPEGQPFETRVVPFGNVYHVGSAADMYELVKRENGLVWQTHPRTKSSTGYPDRLREQDYYQDPLWLGGAFKAMPSDLSSPRLGERTLNLLDDMNNWGGRKFLTGEVDVWEIDHTHELYGHMNVNYLRMSRVPSISDWGEVLEALKRGDFFVTTGEILIRDFLVGGKRSGERIVVTPGSRADIVADLEWTFPLNVVELVWGDGKEVGRMLLPASDTSQFGQRKFHFAKDLTGLKWIRFAAWDIAGNGAFTQPVYIQGGR